MVVVKEFIYYISEFSSSVYMSAWFFDPKNSNINNIKKENGFFSDCSLFMLVRR